MPSLYQLKPAFQARLRPAVGALARAGITANQVTLAGLALSVASGLALITYPHDDGSHKSSAVFLMRALR